ncbi:MAG: Abi family protein [Aquabacterium sp.]|nr:Abi family protein [Aquabacterium sp.]
MYNRFIERQKLLPNPIAFEELISKPRLDSYRGYFHASLDEAIGLYMWNGAVSVCLGTIIAYYEIALRNRLHHAMSTFYSNGGSTSIHWYDRIWAQLKSETQRSIDKIRTERGPGGTVVVRNPAPSPDEVVSRLTFGFWPAILAVIDRRYGSQIFPNVFPHHPLNATPAAWNNRVSRKQATEYIYEVNYIRNRIAHHEPIWKFPAVMNTSQSPPVVVISESLSKSDSIARFRSFIANLDAGIASLSADLTNDLSNSSWRNDLNFLLSDRGVSRYRSLRHVPANGTLSPADLRKNYSLVGKANQPVRIGGRAQFGGIFIPN